MLGEKALNSLLVFRCDVGNDQVLVRSQSEDTLVYLGDLAQGSLERLARFVLDTTVLDESGEMTTAIVTCLPSELIDVGRELVGSCGLKLVAEMLLDLCHEALDAHTVDRVLDTSVLAAVEGGSL